MVHPDGDKGAVGLRGCVAATVGGSLRRRSRPGKQYPAGLVHTGAMNTKPFPPPIPASKSVRLTIPVSREVHHVFQRLAAASSISTGRAMGEWLGDTVEAAEFMASTMERARAAPKIVTAELHALALGVTDETKKLMDKFRSLGKASRVPGRGGALASLRPGTLDASIPSIPPSCNTGGKVPRENPKPKRGRAS